MLALAKLSEDAKGGFRVKECHELVGGTFEGNFVDQSRAVGLGLAELVVNRIGGERNVVNARAVLFEKLGNRALVGRRFEEFQVDVADGKKGGFHFLRFDFFAACAFEAQNGFIIGKGFINGSDGDAKMVDFGDHGVEQGELRVTAVSVGGPAWVGTAGSC